MVWQEFCTGPALPHAQETPEKPRPLGRGKIMCTVGVKALRADIPQQMLLEQGAVNARGNSHPVQQPSDR